MSNIFNARFEIDSYSTLSTNTWQVTGTVIDNSGTFFASSAQPGDIIYNDTSMMSGGVSRYKIISIDSINTQGATLDCIVEWDTLDEVETDPIPGCSSIIGKATGKYKLIALTSIFLNKADEGLLTMIKNYENDKLLDASASPINSPAFLGTPTAPAPTIDSNSDQLPTTKWVRDIIVTTKVDGGTF